jgi:hypothetical protein
LCQVLAIGLAVASISAFADGSSGDGCKPQPVGGSDADLLLTNRASAAGGDVVNMSPTCTYTIGVAVYTMSRAHDPNNLGADLTGQQLTYSFTTTIAPQAMVSLRVSSSNIPNCRYQLDIFEGTHVITNFDLGERYRGPPKRLLGSGYFNQDASCQSSGNSSSSSPNSPLVPTPPRAFLR